MMQAVNQIYDKYYENFHDEHELRGNTIYCMTD